MLTPQLLIGARTSEAGATPPPKGKRDAESLRNNEETPIPRDLALEKKLKYYCRAMRLVWICGEDALSVQ